MDSLTTSVGIGSIDIHVDRFGPDLIHSPISVGVFGAEMAV
jgi:hypothetical protein